MCDLQASLKQLVKNKVNHLCVMVKAIALNNRDASVTLCDPSGEMQGTIHRRLIEDHQAELRPGSVLVLRQVRWWFIDDYNSYNEDDVDCFKLLKPMYSFGK